MADTIDRFKPPPPAPQSHGSDMRGVPAQQARAGWSGFDGGSYFEKNGYAPSGNRHMLDPPPTVGPKATPSEVLAATLEAFRQIQG